MSFPREVAEHPVDEPEVLDTDGVTVLQPARTVTKQAQYVLILELTRNLATYLVRTDNVEQYMQALEPATEGEDQGAQVGCWCIKYMDSTPKYGMLTSEESTGRHVARLYAKQLDRIKALPTIILRDQSSGAVLDTAAVRGI